LKPPINADDRRLELDQITERIIGCIHEVSNALGTGFLEKVYENALAVELARHGLAALKQYRIPVKYRDVLVGDYVADLFVEEKVLVEVKAVHLLDDIHTAQCLNYLKATGLAVCLLVNFGRSRATVKRVVRNF